MLINIILLIFLVISIYTDIKYKKIFNINVLIFLILGFGFNIYYTSINGLIFSLLGFLLGFVILLPFYFLGGIGAGDIKFLMTIGTIKGYIFLFYGTLYGIIVGLVITIIILLFKKTLIKSLKSVTSTIISFITLKNLNTLHSKNLKSTTSISMPYAAIISIGMITQLILTITY